MGRERVWLEQPPGEPVDVASWHADEEFSVYPEGARDKSLFYSPTPAPHAFLVPNHRYLFKHAFNRYPDQFWAEIIAYRGAYWVLGFHRHSCPGIAARACAARSSSGFSIFPANRKNVMWLAATS